MSSEDSDVRLSDEERDLKELEELNAALSDDDDGPSTSTSHYTGTKRLYTVDQEEELSRIDTALALNSLYDEKLRRFESTLVQRLKECRAKLQELQSITFDDNQEKEEIFHYSTCGQPYFRINNHSCPDNEDTKVMKQLGMIDFANATHVKSWTVKDKSQFLQLILKMSRDERKIEYESKVSELQRRLKTSKKKKQLIQKEIDNLNSQIAKVNTLPLKEASFPIDHEYDWVTIANNLQKHTANEYQALWKMFLHPSINKKNWNKAEHLALQSIVSENNQQDWQDIATKLNTGRTKYQCFVYYRTNMSSTFTGRKWTPEEVEYLKRLIDYYKQDTFIPWGQVATAMENRTKMQIYNKYLGLCQERKGRFLPEEDAVILSCAENFGPNYRKMAKFLAGRTINQCRVRYQVLSKTRFSKVWTVAEDKRLIQIMANKDATTNFSELTKLFPGKDRINLRSRYLTLTRWMRRYPNVDVSKAPRRGARKLVQSSQADNLNTAVEELKQRIQSEVNDVKNKKITPESSHEVLDQAIIALLTKEHIDMEEAKKVDEFKKLDEEANENRKRLESASGGMPNLKDIKTILTLLRAKLNKDKFMKTAPEMYRGLLETEGSLSKAPVKTYSRKKTATASGGNLPDIWGSQRLGPLEYVLPPNLSTITGCKQLMSYVDKKPQEEPMNVKISMRKNLLLKEQMFLLLERFNALFLWPMLLSNAAPDTTENVNKETTNEDSDDSMSG